MGRHCHPAWLDLASGAGELLLLNVDDRRPALHLGFYTLVIELVKLHGASQGWALLSHCWRTCEYHEGWGPLPEDRRL